MKWSSTSKNDSRSKPAQRLEDKSVGHETCVEKQCVNAEVGAKLIHQITGPTTWRGGASSLKTSEEDAENEAGVKVKFTEWH